MVQFYPWIILVSFVSYSLSYISIPKNTGKKFKLNYKTKNKNTVHVWPKDNIVLLGVGPLNISTSPGAPPTKANGLFSVTFFLFYVFLTQ